MSEHFDDYAAGKGRGPVSRQRDLDPWRAISQDRYAMYHLTQTTQGISSLEFARRLGITQNAVWKMKHKLAQVMLERNAAKRLKGKVQMDDANLGGERSGPRGRGAKGKTPFVAAATTAPKHAKPSEITSAPGVSAVAASCAHNAIVTGSGSEAAKNPAFKRVNTALGKIKAALVGTYRAVREQHAGRYLAEFEYRLNRRYDLGEMIPRLAVVAVTTVPMPYRLLKLADARAQSGKKNLRERHGRHDPSA